MGVHAGSFWQGRFGRQGPIFAPLPPQNPHPSAVHSFIVPAAGRGNTCVVRFRSRKTALPPNTPRTKERWRPAVECRGPVDQDGGTPSLPSLLTATRRPSTAGTPP